MGIKRVFEYVAHCDACCCERSENVKLEVDVCSDDDGEDTRGRAKDALENALHSRGWEVWGLEYMCPYCC